MARKLLSLVVLLSFAALYVSLAQDSPKPEKLAPYYPTPPGVVEKMLELGKLKPGELHYDLGSGDGRVVIMAAQKFGAHSVGFEIDPKLVEKSRARIAELGLSELARIEQQDLMTADFSKPDLVTVYLLPSSNRKLLPLLEQQMRSGTRIVSHNFAFWDWQPEETVTTYEDAHTDGLSRTLYLYRRR